MQLKLFSGRAHPELAKEIGQILGISVTLTEIKDFRDGEIYLRVGESIRGCDCFVVQPTSRDVNKNLMELLIMIDALKRASAGRITAVIPYYGYARQDRKALSREPITAKLVANLIGKAGANRVLTIDLHSEQVQGFFDMPVDVIQGLPVKASYISSKNYENMVFVAPDVGAVRATRRVAKIFDAPIAIVDKRRPEHGKAEVMNIIGDVKDKTCLLMDDIIDSGGTICEASRALIKNGAKEVNVCITHPVFSPGAVQCLEESPIKEVIVTNTIPLRENLGKIKILSMAPMISEAIRRINLGESLDILFLKTIKDIKNE